jgi:hypothetical protein
LESSKCWGKGDARLTCIACHNPHQELQTDASAYDTNCLSCHTTKDSKDKTASESKAVGENKTISQTKISDHPGAACPVSTKNCVTCHMPKVYVPEMHYNFTDHRIRIARAGEPYPE